MHRIARRLLGCLAGASLLACLLACSGGNADPKGSAPAEIAVVPKGTTHEFWKAVHAGAAAAAAAAGMQVTWKGPVREDDRVGQMAVVDDFVAKRVAGIVLAPLDEHALVQAVERASAAGIPVVIIDSALAGGGPVSFVATDNYQGGVLAARRLGALLVAKGKGKGNGKGNGKGKGKGKALVLRYQVGSASTDARERGFLATLRAEFAGIEIVSDNQYAGGTANDAYDRAQNLLQSFRELDGVFTPNESTTIGMLRALQNDGRAGKVTFVGFDSSEKLVAALRGGEIHGLVLQDPYRIGKAGVEAMVAHLRRQQVAPKVDTGVHLATRENMDSDEMRRLLAPPQR